jgi:hypothetical protein
MTKSALQAEAQMDVNIQYTHTPKCLGSKHVSAGIEGVKYQQLLLNLWETWFSNSTHRGCNILAAAAEPAGNKSSQVPGIVGPASAPVHGNKVCRELTGEVVLGVQIPPLPKSSQKHTPNK